jgi:hypothetical protein
MSNEWTWFDMHGVVSLRVAVGCPTERQLREMFKPFLRIAPDEPDPVADITVTENAPAPLADPSHGEHAYLFTEEAVEVAAHHVGIAVRGETFWVYGKGELLTSVLPLVDRVSVLRGAAMVHAATVALGDAGVCLPAWGGVGKTSTVAKLTRLPNGRFMGDDWAWIDRDKLLLGYAKPMFLKPHHRPIYPQAFSDRRKPLAPSAMTDTVARLATAVHPVIIRYPRLADVTRRWSPEHMMMHPDEVFPAEKIATRVPLRLVCFVERFDGSRPELTARTPEWMVTRIVGNFHTELPKTSRDIVTALGATGIVGLERYFSDKAAVVADSLAGLPTYALRVPAAMSADEASDTVCQQVVDLLAEEGVPT